MLPALFTATSTLLLQLSLKIAGDSAAGPRVEIYTWPRRIVTNSEEFSLHLSPIST